MFTVWYSKGVKRVSFHGQLSGPHLDGEVGSRRLPLPSSPLSQPYRQALQPPGSGDATPRHPPRDPPTAAATAHFQGPAYGRRRGHSSICWKSRGPLSWPDNCTGDRCKTGSPKPSSFPPAWSAMACCRVRICPAS